MSDVSLAISRSLEAIPLREPLLRNLIRSLQLPPGSCGLDAGCGIGHPAQLLAEAVGPAGKVAGVDLFPDVLAFGQERASRSISSGNIAYSAADVNRLPFADKSFDWVWSADCIGYPLGELAPLLGELERVLRSGGSLFLLGWSGQQLLPGYPFLEARLNATCSGYLPFIQGQDPELNFMRAPRWLRAAGLDRVRAQTFVGEVQAPLEPGERAALVSLFEMLWGAPQPGAVSPGVTLEDWRAYQRLCAPGSPDFILDLPGYYAFFTCTLFRARVPGL